MTINSPNQELPANNLKFELDFDATADLSVESQAELNAVSNFDLKADSNATDGIERMFKRYSRRYRSLVRSFKRYLRKLLPAGRVFRAGIMLSLLAAFIHVSLVNNVFGPSREEHGSQSVEASYSIGDTSTTGWVVIGSSENQEDAQIERSYSFASSISNSVESSRSVVGMLVVEETDEYNIVISPLASSAPVAPSVASDKSDRAQRRSYYPVASEQQKAALTDKEPTVHVVNEGGSLWRTAKRFIDDDVLVDKLIDDLAEKGMDVRNVRPGVEILVSHLGSDGLLVVIDIGGNTYESRIFDKNVQTRKLHVATNELG